MRVTITTCDNCGVDCSGAFEPVKLNGKTLDVCPTCSAGKFTPLAQRPGEWPKVVTTEAVLDWLKHADRLADLPAGALKAGEPMTGPLRELELAVLNVPTTRTSLVRLRADVEALQSQVRKDQHPIPIGVPDAR